MTCGLNTVSSNILSALVLSTIACFILVYRYLAYLKENFSQKPMLKYLKYHSDESLPGRMSPWDHLFLN